MNVLFFTETLPVIGDVANISSDAIGELISKINMLTTLFQAIGGFIIAYVLFNIIGIILEKKKNKEIYEIKKLLVNISKKIK